MALAMALAIAVEKDNMDKLKKLMFGIFLMLLLGSLFGFLVFEFISMIPQIEFVGTDHGSGETFSGSLQFKK